MRVKDLGKASKLDKRANAWVSPSRARVPAELIELRSQDNASAHPSQFLTTKDGKPRLFPFPLGKAGGSKALKGELWWEAGNAAHV